MTRARAAVLTAKTRVAALTVVLAVTIQATAQSAILKVKARAAARAGSLTATIQAGTPVTGGPQEAVLPRARPPRPRRRLFRPRGRPIW